MVILTEKEIKDVLTNFIESIKNYQIGEKSNIALDRRGLGYFVDVFIKHNSHLKAIIARHVDEEELESYMREQEGISQSEKDFTKYANLYEDG